MALSKNEEVNHTENQLPIVPAQPKMPIHSLTIRVAEPVCDDLCCLECVRRNSGCRVTADAGAGALVATRVVQELFSFGSAIGMGPISAIGCRNSSTGNKLAGRTGSTKNVHDIAWAVASLPELDRDHHRLKRRWGFGWLTGKAPRGGQGVGMFSQT